MHGNATKDGATVPLLGFHFYNDAAKLGTLSDGAEVRLVAKSATITNVGERMYRGGYMTCSRLPQGTTHDSSSNATSWAIRDNQVSLSQVTAFDGDRGVYAVLQPHVQADMCAWKHFDTSEPFLYYPSIATPTPISLSSSSSLSEPESNGWLPSVIRFTPPSPWKSDGTANWSLRATVCQQWEYRAPSSEATDAVPFDPSVLTTLFALCEYQDSFYPASYNDLKSVMRRVREAYKRYQPLIDVAAGYIPYGNAVNSGVKALLDGVAKA